MADLKALAGFRSEDPIRWLDDREGWVRIILGPRPGENRRKPLVRLPADYRVMSVAEWLAEVGAANTT